MRDCPLKGDQGVATLRAYRAEEAAKLDAVLEAPVELVIAQPFPGAAEDLPTPPPGRGGLLDDQRGGAGDELAAPPLSAEVKHEGSVCDLGQVAGLAILPLSGASARVEKEEGCSAATGWNRDDPDEDFAEFAVDEPDVAPTQPRAPLAIVPPPPLSLVEPIGSDPTPALERARAKLAIRADAMGRPSKQRQVTISGRLSRDERRAGEDIEYPAGVDRPRVRGDCSDMPRPCPFVSCRHHLYLDVNEESGAIKFNFPHLEVWEMRESCSLDVADRGGAILEDVGAILGLVRERIRQIEVRGLARMKDVAGGELGLMPDRADRDVG